MHEADGERLVEVDVPSSGCFFVFGMGRHEVNANIHGPGGAGLARGSASRYE